MKLVIFVFLLQLLSQVLAVCPSECNCSSQTFKCIECLQQYGRVYNQTDGSCGCLTGYVEKNPVQSYCCSPYCASCNDMGCTSCPMHF